MPRRRERTGLGLAVTDHAGDDEVGVVERHAVRMREAVAELAALVNGARRFRRDVAPDMAREGELLEELLHPFRVLALVRIDLRVGPFQIRGRQHPWCAVAGPGDEDHVEVVLDDHPVEMHPREGERRARTPVAEQTVLHIVGFQGFLEERVVLQIDHPDSEVVAGPPVGVHRGQLFVRQRLFDRHLHFQLFVRQHFRHGSSPVQAWLIFGGSPPNTPACPFRAVPMRAAAALRPITARRLPAPG